MNTTCSKRFKNFPAAHRQPKHDGHCRFIHGHDWSFDITFGAVLREPTGTNFVVDFGKLEELKALLKHQFDHTCLVTIDDPELVRFQGMYADKLIDMRVMKDTSAEGMAEWVLTHANNIIKKITNDRAWVERVVCWEDEKNSAEATL